MEKRIEKIEKTLEHIQKNDLKHLSEDMIETKLNVKWLLKFFWIVAVASIGGLIASVISLL